jgi:hypothetical protein
MKQLIACAIVAAVVAVAVLLLEEGLEADDEAPMGEQATGTDSSDRGAAPILGYTMELPEDVWVDAARTSGSDERSLADAENSICFLTKIEISGVQSPGDTNRCEIGIDDFTGFWELVATVEEGGQSEVRCNARCLTWE